MAEICNLHTHRKTISITFFKVCASFPQQSEYARVEKAKDWSHCPLILIALECMLWEAPSEIRDLFIHLLGAPLARALRCQPSALLKITTPSEGSPCPMPVRHSYKNWPLCSNLRQLWRPSLLLQSIPESQLRSSTALFTSPARSHFLPLHVTGANSKNTP